MTVEVNPTINQVAAQSDTGTVGVDQIVTEVVVTETGETFVTITAPGPQGPRGIPGGQDVTDFFQTALRFAELDSEIKRAAARANLGLQTIDGGTFN